SRIRRSGSQQSPRPTWRPAKKASPLHLFTDSKAALKEAVARPSERLSPYEVISKNGGGRVWRDFAASIHRARFPSRNPVARSETYREPFRHANVGFWAKMAHEI